MRRRRQRERHQTQYQTTRFKISKTKPCTCVITFGTILRRPQQNNDVKWLNLRYCAWRTWAHDGKFFILCLCQISAILYASRGDRRKWQSLHRAHLAIFADRGDRRIKSPGVSLALVPNICLDTFNFQLWVSWLNNYYCSVCIISVISVVIFATISNCKLI